MGLFEVANELVVLDGIRRLEWQDTSALSSRPTTSTAGIDVSDTTAGAVWIDPAAGAYPIYDVYGYLGAETGGPEGWSPIQTNQPTGGVPTSHILANLGPFDQISVVSSNLSELKLARGILE